MLRASFLLLAILLSVAASQRPPVLMEARAVQKLLCTCERQCGVCGGRLRGCFNGIPICECFQC